MKSSVLPVALLLTLLSGCRIHKSGEGKNENVEIGTPFGSMNVKTDKAADTSAIGLSVYPGATPEKDGDNGHDNQSADINMSFGNFHLGVKAASFLSSDPQEKIIAFYQKDMARYGDVLECQGEKPVGQLHTTSQGLACNSVEGHHHVSNTADLELRAGSPQHMHIVGLDEKDGGTKIGLVQLDLPSHLGSHDSKDSE